MPSVTGFSVKHENATYRLDISWDDEEFMKGAITFGAEVSVQFEDGGEFSPVTGASISVIDEEGEPILVILIKGEERFRGPLTDIVGEETVFDRIPPIIFGEPISGCLLRAGISATVSQILHCKDTTAGHDWFLPRTKQIGFCLKEHGKQLAGRALLKAGICMVTQV